MSDATATGSHLTDAEAVAAGLPLVEVDGPTDGLWTWTDLAGRRRSLPAVLALPRIHNEATSRHLDVDRQHDGARGFVVLVPAGWTPDP